MKTPEEVLKKHIEDIYVFDKSATSDKEVDELRNGILAAMEEYVEQQIKASKKKHTEEFVVLLGKEHGNVFWTMNKDDLDIKPYYVLEYTDDERRAIKVCNSIRQY